MNPLDYIDKFKNLKIAVIGDAILDGYLYGNPHQLCREAPVPVIILKNEQYACGGAANTAINAARLGAKVDFLSVIGQDKRAKQLLKILKESGVNTEHVLFDKERATLYKQRVLAGTQMLLRIDRGSGLPLKEQLRSELISRLNEAFSSFHALIISDYSGGVMTPDIVREISRLQRTQNHLVSLDARFLHSYCNKGINFIKPNYFEFIRFMGLSECVSGRRIGQVLTHGQELLKRTGAEIAAVTLDEDGALVFERGHSPYRTFARNHENPNSAGAGDTFTAAFVMSICSGADVSVASEIASLACNTAIGKKGTTASCSLKELKGHFWAGDKSVDSLTDLSQLSTYYHSQQKRIVFTNGCFDILHRGHIHFLSQCKAMGDVLIVGVNSDESVKKIKGANSPINRLNDRLQVLSSLSCVDHVMGFGQPAPIEIIKALRPHLFIKGNNHTLGKLPEVGVVRKLGGKTRLLPLLKEYSTTAIIQRAGLIEKELSKVFTD